MRGVDHGMISVATWLAVAPELPYWLADPRVARYTHHAHLAAPSVTVLALGAVLAAGAGLLCDWDHHDASAAHTFPGGVAIASAVESATGGHRHGTHSTVAMLGAVYGGWWLAGRTWWALALAFMCAALTLHIVPWYRAKRVPAKVAPRAWRRVQFRRRFWWEKYLWPRFALLVALALAGGIVWAGPLGRWLGVVMAVGVVSHIGADMFNPEGWMPFWPILRFRLRIPLFRTAGRVEEVFTYLFASATVYVMVLRF